MTRAVPLNALDAGLKSADDVLKYLPYFPRKEAFGRFLNLHEMSKHVLGGNKKYVASLPSAEFAQRVVIVNRVCLPLCL